MRSVIVLGGVLAAVAVMGSNDRLTGIPTDAVATASPAGDTYLLQFAGLDASCTVSRAAAPESGDARLVIGNGCSETLARASLWRDNADGSVSFLSPNGRTVLEFAQGDGLAYETFRAGAPLATLISAD
jgi:hypothetical protein